MTEKQKEAMLAEYELKAIKQEREIISTLMAMKGEIMTQPSWLQMTNLQKDTYITAIIKAGETFSALRRIKKIVTKG